MSQSSDDSNPVATATDVRNRLNLPNKSTAQDIEITSGISDNEIATYLEDANFELRQATNLSRLDDELQKQLEWRLAGIAILSTRKGLRSYHQQSLGSMSRSYETRSVDELKDWVRRHGPSGLLEDDEFWSASIQG